jgi:hypothetical protein
MLDPTTMHDDAKDLFRRAQPEALKAMPLGAPGILCRTRPFK